MKKFNHDRIQALREAHGLSLAAFARKIGKTRSHVFNWENKGYVPEAETILMIADKFDVSVDYFFRDN